MYFKMFKAQGLAHLSYMLGNQGSAIIVDPKRDISEYLEAAQSEGFKIKYKTEKKGLSIFKKDNPVLARLIFTKS